MDPHGSVTYWIGQLQRGDRDVAQKLWERYFERLVGLAREKLRNAPRRAADEEDVAIVAFDSFFRRAEQGRFPNLHDRTQLWNLLFTITERKAAKLILYEGQQKRDWRQTNFESHKEGESADRANDLLNHAGNEPDPQFAAQIAEECRRLFCKLDKEELRLIAVRKMEGYTNEEIANQIGCAIPTIERRLRVIRKCWEQEIPNQTDA